MGTYSRDIPKLILLTRKNLPQNSPHNLPRPRLGKIRHNINLLRRRKRPDALAHLHDELLAQRVRHLAHPRRRHERVDGLARKLVCDAHHRRLADVVVLKERRLNLGRREAVAADVYDVVDAAADPVVALVVTARAVTGKLSSC